MHSARGRSPSFPGNVSRTEYNRATTTSPLELAEVLVGNGELWAGFQWTWPLYSLIVDRHNYSDDAEIYGLDVDELIGRTNWSPASGYWLRHPTPAGGPPPKSCRRLPQTFGQRASGPNSARLRLAAPF